MERKSPTTCVQLAVRISAPLFIAAFAAVAVADPVTPGATPMSFTGGLSGAPLHDYKSYWSSQSIEVSPPGTSDPQLARMLEMRSSAFRTGSLSARLVSWSDYFADPAPPGTRDTTGDPDSQEEELGGDENEGQVTPIGGAPKVPAPGSALLALAALSGAGWLRRFR